MNIIFLRGTLNYEDVLNYGTNEEITEIENSQENIQIDDICNIQFTSVSLKDVFFNTTNVF